MTRLGRIVAGVLLLAWVAWLHTSGPLAEPGSQSAGGQDGAKPARVQGAASASALLENRRLALTAQARRDLAVGRVDPQLRRLLAVVLARHRVSVSVIRGGHSRYVAGTRRISKHTRAKAVDIWAVDGGRVSPGHRQSRRLVAWLLTLPKPQRPAEIGSPFGQFDRGPGDGVFTDAAHQDHLHLAVP